jgi:hypothetical protein
VLVRACHACVCVQNGRRVTLAGARTGIPRRTPHLLHTRLLQEQAERLLAVLRALLTSGDAATSAAMQQRVLQPLATAVGGLRAALRGETGACVRA